MIQRFLKNTILLILFCTFILLDNSSFAQNSNKEFTKIQVSGYLRSNICFRNLSENYISGGAYTPQAFIINGVYPDNPLGNGLHIGYREPLLMLRLQGKPTKNTNIDVDFLLDNQMTSDLQNISNDYPKRIQSYRYLNFSGDLLTSYGKFDIAAGGVIFFNLTPATLSNLEYRDDMFERYPWEWQTISFKRYTSFYEDKNISRDSRWGSGTIQGFTLCGTRMPLRTGFKIAYGKSNNTGGFQSYLNNNNQDVLAAQLNKKIFSHFVSLNYYHSQAILNPSKFANNFSNISKQEMITAEVKLNFKNFSVHSESGSGSIVNPVDSIQKWNPYLNIKANFNKEMLSFPFSIQYYYIGADVVNLTSAILNTSNRNVQPQYGQELKYNTTIFESAVTELGHLANNRQSVSISAGKDIKNLKFSLALSSAQELENKFNMVSFQHRLNGINRSQFIFYRNEIGPYKRQMTQWRRSWEKIALNDSNPSYKKAFNLIDFSIKLKTNLFGKQLILSNYINYNSVQDYISPIAVFNSKAFLRLFYEEFMFFYNVHPKITLIGLIGYEKNRGNTRTILADNGKGIDQTGHGYGLGVDFDLTQNAGLYLRQRWYSFSDKNFTLDHFSGYETNVELKIFF